MTRPIPADWNPMEDLLDEPEVPTVDEAPASANGNDWLVKPTLRWHESGPLGDGFGRPYRRSPHWN